VAQVANQLAVLRSMTTPIGDHGLAHYLARTGYRQGLGGLAYPHMGAVVANELGRPEATMPNYVVIKTGGGYLNGIGHGHLPAKHAPTILRNIAGGIPNLETKDGLAAFDKRAGLLDSIELDFLKQYQSVSAEVHRATYRQAVQLMHSAAAAQKPFKLEEESEETRNLYGDSKFGKECLLARRLIEAGVLFVEVIMPGWDSHGGGEKAQPKKAGDLDAPYAALIADLKQRGLLDSTLVIWMGEFGRDISGNDHNARAWTSVLAGAGLKTGQVIGRTDKKTRTVEDRPITISDFLATVYKALDIDYTKNFKVQNRPIGMVAKNPGGAEVQPLRELFA
jgi:hypothetical protein